VSKVFGDMVSYRNALFYAMTGRTIDGRKAVELGIATLSVPAEKLCEETVTIARELMAKAPMVLAYTKASDPRRARHGHGSSIRIFGREEYGPARGRSGTDARSRHARISRREKIQTRTRAAETAGK
jgi:enoyl-CoA hydratase/carnithine racemase